MDLLGRTEKLFQNINDELGQLMRLLGPHANSKEALAEMGKILENAQKIGGKLFDEAKALQGEIQGYIHHPTEDNRIRVLQDAMHIKHEVREL